MLRYMRMHASPRIPDWVLRAEAAYAHPLINRLWWEDQIETLDWMRTGQRRGMFLSEIAHATGMRSREGARQRMDRLEALLQFARPYLDGVLVYRLPAEPKPWQRSRPPIDVDALAERRRIERATAVERRWVEAHHDELVALSKAFTEEADRYGLLPARDAVFDEVTGDVVEDEDDGERYHIDQLAADVRNEDVTPGSVARLGLAVTELRTAPKVLELDVPRPTLPVFDVLRRADRLRKDFADLGHLNPPEKRPNRPVRFRRKPSPDAGR
ncbi:hypothetical protein [Saccharothrix sp. HUAS TT1]|uniref:hypothetical protein n=1 Tax=unclassified Saccharothrix TaxID=2593673 RepID=UPI00345B97C3